MPPLDTLAAKGNLTGVGFTEAQAEAVTYLIDDAISEHVATKAEIMEVRNDFLKMLYVATGIIVTVLLGIEAVG